MLGHDSEKDVLMRSNNELRAKMEKLRLENALLKDQIRALRMLPPDLSSVYIFIQVNTEVTFAKLKGDAQFSQLSNEELDARLKALLDRGVIETGEKGILTYYSVKTPDLAEAWFPKSGKSENVRSLDVPLIDAGKPAYES